MNTISFKGYDNVYAGYTESSNGSMMVLSAELNNEGTSDLNQYRALKEMNSHEHVLSSNNIMTMIHTHTKDGDTLYIGDKMYLNGDEIKTLGDKSMKELLNINDYKQLEKEHLKLYTLIINLTKQMQNCTILPKNANIDYTKCNILRSLKSLTGDDFAALEIFEKLTTNQFFTYKEIAEKFNKYIGKTMKNYF